MSIGTIGCFRTSRTVGLRQTWCSSFGAAVSSRVRHLFEEYLKSGSGEAISLALFLSTWGKSAMESAPEQPEVRHVTAHADNH